MNDNDVIDAVDRHGPDATPLTDATLGAARARLDAAFAAGHSTTARHSRRLPLFAAASAVAAAAAGLAVLPALIGSDDAVALAAVDPMTFPVTADWLPSVADDPVFSYDSGRAWARYGSGDDRIVISAAAELNGDCRDDDAVRVDINGRPGWGFDGCADEPPGPAANPVQYFIVWEEPDGDVLQVSGGGRYADPELVERVAESVHDKPQTVDLFLTVAPMGWQLRGYQSDHHVTWSDPDWEQGGEGSDLTVGLIDRVQVDLDAYGARDVRPVTIDGRHGMLGRQVDEDATTVLWILQATAPDGTPFSLTAPGRFSEAQVIEVAAGIRHH